MSRPRVNNIVAPGIRRCIKCLQELPDTKFPARPKRGDYREPTCYVCRAARAEELGHDKAKYMRERKIRSYGTTAYEVAAMLDKQNGCCITCGRSGGEFKYGLVIDHDHITGEIRGLLCSSCNSALGHVRDDIQVLFNMIAYLRRHKGDIRR